MSRLPKETEQARLEARFLRRAIETNAPLLASALHQHAEQENLTWAELAAQLGCSEEALSRIALCRPPRPERFTADVRDIAGDEADPDRLLPLLRRLYTHSVVPLDRAAETRAEYDASPVPDTESP